MKRWLLLGIIFVSVICSAGCEERTQKKEELTVVAELEYEVEVKAAAAYYQEKNPGAFVNVEFLPKEETTRRNVLQKKRTDIMSGKGADVFFLSCNIEIAEGYEEPLLENVNKSIESGIFTSLDYYMDQDDYWKSGSYHKKLLEAGQMKGRQYVIPLACNYFVYVGPEDSVIEGKTLWDWMDETGTSGRKELTEGTVFGLGIMNARWQQPAVNYEEKEVLFDPDKWSKFMLEYLAYWQRSHEEEAGGADVYAVANICTLPDQLTGQETKANCQIVPDLNGNKMAAVSTYGAVAMASENKEAAYDFLMLFLNGEIEKEKGASYAGLWYGGTRGAPVEENAWESFMDIHYILNEATRENVVNSFRELDGAYFPGETEQKLYDAGDELILPGREMSGEEIQELVHKAADRAKEQYSMIVRE